MTTIASTLQAVNARIAKAAADADRQAGEITLLAVSKTMPIAAIRAAHSAGQADFGENYVQEALEKIRATTGLKPIAWHFIGPIQSNKTKLIAENFSWVHSVDRQKIAERLSRDRPESLPPLQICLQVNVSGEDSKSGVTPDQVSSLAVAIARLPRLKLRGLMAIPEPTTDTGLQRSRFRQLRELLDQLKQKGLELDTLSMGMSHDLEAAISEGATIVRVGTAIFGERGKTANSL